MGEFKKWYAEHKDEYNQGRRDKYRTNKDYREKERARIRAYRAKNPKKRASDRRFVEIEGDKVEVFAIGKLAKLFDVTTAFIRRLEHRRMIPEPTVSLDGRYYTRTQIGAMAPLVAHWKENAMRARVAEVRLDTDELVQIVYEEWLSLAEDGVADGDEC